MSTCYGPFDVRLVRREQLSPHFVRITLAGRNLGHCGDVLLDQRVKLLIGGDLDAILGPDWYGSWLALDETTRPQLRTYTLADVRAHAVADAEGEVSGEAEGEVSGEEGEVSGEVDIDVVVGDHPGPGAEFAAHAPLGTRAVLIGAIRGAEGWDSVGVAWQPGAARQVLIMGDATAVPAIRNIVATLEGTDARIVIETPGPDHRLDVGAEVIWCDDLAEAAARLLGAPGAEGIDESGGEDLVWQEATGPGSRYVWVAGEAGRLKRVRAALRGAGYQRHEISVMGYWRAGAAS